MSRKFAGSPPAILIMSMRRHGEAGAVDDAADVAFEADIGKPAIGWHRSRADPPATCRAARQSAAGGTGRFRRTTFLRRAPADLPSLVTTSGLISTIDGVEIAKRAIAAHDRGHVALLTMLGFEAERRTRFRAPGTAACPTAGSTVDANDRSQAPLPAISSISMPPAADATIMTRSALRSSTKPR